MKIIVLNQLAANLDDIYLTLESQNWNLNDIAPVMYQKPVAMSNVAGDATCNIWLDVPMKVQAVGSGAGAGTYRTLTDSDPATIRQLTAATFANFEQGRNYLLRCIDGGLTNKMPKETVWTFNTNTGGIAAANAVLNARRYLYTAEATEGPLGATTFDAITFERDILQVVKNEEDNKRRKRTILASIASSQLGAPVVNVSPQLAQAMNLSANGGIATTQMMIAQTSSANNSASPDSFNPAG